MANASHDASSGLETSNYPRIGMFIDGTWQYDGESCMEIRNPSDERLIGHTPRATDADLARALDAAGRGFVTWRNTPPEERVRVIQRAVDLLRERADSIARIITLEHGKPLAEARGEVA